jgi:hypothetical protein
MHQDRKRCSRCRVRCASPPRPRGRGAGLPVQAMECLCRGHAHVRVEVAITVMGDYLFIGHPGGHLPCPPPLRWGQEIWLPPNQLRHVGWTGSDHQVDVAVVSVVRVVHREVPLCRASSSEALLPAPVGAGRFVIRATQRALGLACRPVGAWRRHPMKQRHSTRGGLGTAHFHRRCAAPRRSSRPRRARWGARQNAAIADPGRAARQDPRSPRGLHSTTRSANGSHERAAQGSSRRGRHGRPPAPANRPPLRRQHSHHPRRGHPLPSHLRRRRNRHPPAKRTTPRHTLESQNPRSPNLNQASNKS